MKKRILVALSVVLVAVMLVVTVGAKSFEDVVEGAWYYDAVDYVSDAGLMKGTNTEQTVFDPTRILTRAEMAVMLYNLEVEVNGEPEAAEDAPFVDIDNVKSWAGTAINWAYANGIVKGTNADGTNFSPMVTLNRASMAVMFTNYINLIGMTDVVDITRVDENLIKVESFGDEFDWDPDVWFWDAVHYVGKTALMGGKDSGNPDTPNFDPEGTASRAEAATVLARLHKFLQIPTLGAEKAWADFKAEYVCKVHGNQVYFFYGRGKWSNYGNTPELNRNYIYDYIYDVVDAALDYDRDVYELVCETDLYALTYDINNGASPESHWALVNKETGESISQTMYCRFEQQDLAYYLDVPVNIDEVAPIALVPERLACWDQKHNYASEVQTLLDERFDAMIDYLTGADGKMYVYVSPNYDPKGKIPEGETEYNYLGYNWGWQKALQHAMLQSGIADMGYVLVCRDWVDNFGDDAFAQYYSPIYSAMNRDLADDGKAEITTKISLEWGAYAKEWNGDVRIDSSITDTTRDAICEKEITIVFIQDDVVRCNTKQQSEWLVAAGVDDVAAEKEAAKEALNSGFLCAECGKLHFIADDSYGGNFANAEKLLADLRANAISYMDTSRWTIDNLVLSEDFAAKLAALPNSDLGAKAEGTATLYIGSVAKHDEINNIPVEVTMTVTNNWRVWPGPDYEFPWITSKVINVCYENDDTNYAQIALDDFVSEFLCGECGRLHYVANPSDEKYSNFRTMKGLSRAMLNAMTRGETMGFYNSQYSAYVALRWSMNNGTKYPFEKDSNVANAIDNNEEFEKVVFMIHHINSDTVATTAQTVTFSKTDVLSSGFGKSVSYTNPVTSEVKEFCIFNTAAINEFKAQMDVDCEKAIRDGFAAAVAAEGVNGTITIKYNANASWGTWQVGNTKRLFLAPLSDYVNEAWMAQWEPNVAHAQMDNDTWALFNTAGNGTFDPAQGTVFADRDVNIAIKLPGGKDITVTVKFTVIRDDTFVNADGGAIIGVFKG